MSKILNDFFQRFKLARKSPKIMLISGIFLLFILILLNILNTFYGFDPLKITDDMLSSPSMKHFMGTDQLGRDIFSRVCTGTINSLTIALVSVSFSLTLGAPIGALSGFFAGKTDRILSVIFDALYAFPGIILAILIAAMVGPGVITTSLAISVEYMPQYYRVVRGLTLSLKERPFIEALRSLGAPTRKLVFHHILIYSIPSIIALAMLNMGSAILAISGLGFLGLGLPPPTPEWGTDLGSGRKYIPMGFWWLSTFPGVMIAISIIAFTLIGEGLNEILKPQVLD